MISIAPKITLQNKIDNLHDCEYAELTYADLGSLCDIKYVTKRLRVALPNNKKELVSIFCENFVWKDEKAH